MIVKLWSLWFANTIEAFVYTWDSLSVSLLDVRFYSPVINFITHFVYSKKLERCL